MRSFRAYSSAGRVLPGADQCCGQVNTLGLCDVLVEQELPLAAVLATVFWEMCTVFWEVYIVFLEAFGAFWEVFGAFRAFAGTQVFRKCSRAPTNAR